KAQSARKQVAQVRGDADVNNPTPTQKCNTECKNIICISTPVKKKDPGALFFLEACYGIIY
ncbi:MAG TPA: hypothetical protein IAB13_02325, partial [Candidatus Avanaerovorax faecigallinarum]|nr:hypothetical protein [Candidatus Avanaerovorax faecigallinarum]